MLLEVLRAYIMPDDSILLKIFSKSRSLSAHEDMKLQVVNVKLVNTIVFLLPQPRNGEIV